MANYPLNITVTPSYLHYCVMQFYVLLLLWSYHKTPKRGQTEILVWPLLEFCDNFTSSSFTKLKFCTSLLKIHTCQLALLSFK